MWWLRRHLPLFIPFIELGVHLFHTRKLPMNRKQLEHLSHHPLRLFHDMWQWEWHALIVWGVVAGIAMPVLAVYLRRVLVVLLRRHRTLVRSRPAVHEISHFRKITSERSNALPYEARGRCLRYSLMQMAIDDPKAAFEQHYLDDDEHSPNDIALYGAQLTFPQAALPLSIFQKIWSRFEQPSPPISPL
jgi:hypothetical protein